MRQQLFTSPRVRDKAIETTCSNLVMAGGILTPQEVSSFMTELTGYTDVQLGIALIESRLLLDEYLEKCWSRN